MKFAPTVLGIAGGIMALYIITGLIFALAFTVSAENSDEKILLTNLLLSCGFLWPYLPVLGIVGGALSPYSPQLAGVLMLSSSFGSGYIIALEISLIQTRIYDLIGSLVFSAVVIFCLAMGGILALRTNWRHANTPAPAQTLG